MGLHSVLTTKRRLNIPKKHKVMILNKPTLLLRLFFPFPLLSSEGFPLEDRTAGIISNDRIIEEEGEAVKLAEMGQELGQ